MAPELWQGKPASRTSDIYSIGVLMRILLVGSPPYAALTPYELLAATEDHSVEPTANLVPDLNQEFAAIVDRCLSLEPSQRFATGDALRTALEAISDTEHKTAAFTGNPYRGLRAFEAEHRSLFFGRTIETRTLVDRLRAEAFVLVAGDSGVGKSSLCRAGVAPEILDGTLDRDREWEAITLIPGRRPLQSLIAALAQSLDFHEASLSSLVETKLDSVGWFVRKKLGSNKGRLLLLDQLEEMVTIADPEEARLAGAVLAQFAVGIPGMRTIATVRGDFLTRVAQIPSLGDELMRAIYILRPLSADALREAITGPAATQGVSYAPQVVDQLIDAGREGSLPLLQFALAELWEIHTDPAQPIGSSDLKRIGGVTGALARHADGVLSAMLPAQRQAARSLLSRLVTIENTRASLTETELTGEDADMRAALEGLVRGRLLVVRETEADPVFEIAHEALIRGWGTLTRWLEAEQEKRAARHQLETTAAEWDRRERPRDMLYSPTQLAAAQALDRTNLRQIERDFLDRSQAHIRRSLLIRRLAIASLPVLVIGTYLFVQIRNYRATQNIIRAKLAEGQQELERARQLGAEVNELRQQAYDAFDAGEHDSGQNLWKKVEQRESKLTGDLRNLAQDLEATLTLDPDSEPTRFLLADTLYTRAVLAEQMYQTEQTGELLARMQLYDIDGSRDKQWRAPGLLALTTSPENVDYTIEKYMPDESGRLALHTTEFTGTTPLTELKLEPGSYRINLSKQGFTDVYAPVLIRRNEPVSFAIQLPTDGQIPPNFIYVPAGRTLYGSSDRKLWNFFYQTVPIHAIETEAFLVAKYETTYAEWIAFLETLPAELRKPHIPGGGSEQGIDSGLVQVSEEPPRWQLRLSAGDTTYNVEQSQQLRYTSRKQRIEQDWEQLPVTNVTLKSALAYIQWLEKTGRVPGAHLCSEFEWERAARGADGRSYPHGESVAPQDLNFDETYNKITASMGPDEIGSYPNSVSPFGALDMGGNVFEWVASTDEASEYARGGSFSFDRISCTTTNRAPLPPNSQDPNVGLRVCGRLVSADTQ